MSIKQYMLVALCFLMSAAAFAKGPPKPTISEVLVDTGAGLIAISGSNFD